MRLKYGQLIAAVAALVLIASATTFAQSSAGQRALRDLGVGGQPSRYTELAFVDPSKLPNVLYQVPSRVPITFTIGNREPAATTYRWQIWVTRPVRRVLRAGEMHVARGGRGLVDTSILLGCSSRTQIAVLLSSGERVDFWADCASSSVRGRR